MKIKLFGWTVTLGWTKLTASKPLAAHGIYVYEWSL